LTVISSELQSTTYEKLILPSKPLINSLRNKSLRFYFHPSQPFQKENSEEKQELNDGKRILIKQQLLLMKGIKMKNEFLIKQRDINYGGKVINTHPRQRETRRREQKIRSVEQEK
jgi:hypothetical protein